MQPHVGIIGAGLIGRFHARGVHGLTKLGLVDARYVAVCDRQLERAESFARIADLDLATDDPEELIASPSVNTVYICTPTAEHNELVLRAAAAGKHVFCEKPLARTLAGAQEMYNAVRRAGVRHQVGLIMHHSPVLPVPKGLASDPPPGRAQVVPHFPTHHSSASTKRLQNNVRLTRRRGVGDILSAQQAADCLGFAMESQRGDIAIRADPLVRHLEAPNQFGDHRDGRRR